MNIEYIKFMCTLWFLKECEYRYEDSFNDVIQYNYDNIVFIDEI